MHNVIEPKGKDQRKLKKQYVFFYGSENFAWIPEESIWTYMPNKDKFVLTARVPKGFKEAVESIEDIFKGLPVSQPTSKSSELPSIEDELAAITRNEPKGKGSDRKDYSKPQLSAKGKLPGNDNQHETPEDMCTSHEEPKKSSQSYKPVPPLKPPNLKNSVFTKVKCPSCHQIGVIESSPCHSSEQIEQNKYWRDEDLRSNESIVNTDLKKLTDEVEIQEPRSVFDIFEDSRNYSEFLQRTDTSVDDEFLSTRRAMESNQFNVKLEKQEDLMHERTTPITDKKNKDSPKGTPKSTTKLAKKRLASPHIADSTPKSKKTKLVKSSSPPSKRSDSPILNSASTNNSYSKSSSYIEKAAPSTSTVTASASSTSASNSKDLTGGYDGWSSSIRKESPLFDRSYDRILDPSMVEPILSKSIIPTPLKIGFLGLGIMGSGMVANLLRSGHEVTVWNRTPSKCREFAKEGALKGNSPAEVVQQCDITLSCVADPTALKDLVFGNCGVLQGISQGKAYVDMSTVDVETITDVHEAVTARGGRFLEAPIVGSKNTSSSGSLIILAAGDRSLYEDCYSCFEAMGKRSFYLGEIGSAAKMKLVLNLFMGTLVAGLAESLALAEKVGLDQEEVLQILDLSHASCPLVKSQGSAMILSNYSEPHCKLNTTQKDLRLAVNLSDTVDQPLHVGSAVNELYKKAKAKGYGEHDTTAVYRAADV